MKMFYNLGASYLFFANGVEKTVGPHLLRVILIFVNNADPDEMLRLAAFHLCLHNLTMYPF